MAKESSIRIDATQILLIQHQLLLNQEKFDGYKSILAKIIDFKLSEDHIKILEKIEFARADVYASKAALEKALKPDKLNTVQGVFGQFKEIIGALSAQFKIIKTFTSNVIESTQEDFKEVDEQNSLTDKIKNTLCTAISNSIKVMDDMGYIIKDLISAKKQPIDYYLMNAAYLDRTKTAFIEVWLEKSTQDLSMKTAFTVVSQAEVALLKLIRPEEFAEAVYEIGEHKVEQKKAAKIVLHQTQEAIDIITHMEYTVCRILQSIDPEILGNSSDYD